MAARPPGQHRRARQPAGTTAAQHRNDRSHAVRRHVGQRRLPGAARGARVQAAGAEPGRRRAARQERHGGDGSRGRRAALGGQFRRRSAASRRRRRHRRADRWPADRSDPEIGRAELRRDAGRVALCRIDRGSLPIRRRRQQPRPRSARRGSSRRHRPRLRRRPAVRRRRRPLGRRRRQRPVPARCAHRTLSRLPARCRRARLVDG